MEAVSVWQERRSGKNRSGSSVGLMAVDVWQRSLPNSSMHWKTLSVGNQPSAHLTSSNMRFHIAMFKNLEFDDLIVAAVGNPESGLATRQSELAPELQAKITAIVEAPNWTEQPVLVAPRRQALPPSETSLKGKSAFFGITGIVAILCGVVLGFLFESSMVVYLCCTIAIAAIGMAFILQTRERGCAAALGIALTPDGTLTRGDFVKYQMTIHEILKATAKVGAVSLLVLLAWQLSRIDQRILGTDDSLAAALIRLATICLVPLTIWLAWKSWRKAGAMFQIARCFRGLLARHLSAFWVSWLYEAKTTLPKPEKPEPTRPTVHKIAMDNWPQPAIFFLSAAFFANTQWFDGIITNVTAATPDQSNKWSWVNDILIWMHQHPTSTLFAGATLASVSIAWYAHQLLQVVHPQLANRYTATAFLLSIILFAAIGSFSRS